MNKLQIGIPIGVGIIISMIVLIILLNDTQQEMEVENLVDKDEVLEESVLPEIQEKLDEIKKVKIENEYSPKPREWITSGPFQIDRSEYWIGEKIFMRINDLQTNEKGQIIFLRPLNETHHTTYLNIPFDGTEKRGFNWYAEPELSKIKNICSINDILGEWIIIFEGTKYKNLNFKINNQILPGEENDYVSVC